MLRSLSLMLILSPALAFGQGRLDVDFTPGLIQLVPGVYAYEGPLDRFCCDVNRKVPLKAGERDILRTNSLVVVTDEGVLVADGQDTPDLGRRMLAEIRKVTDKPMRYLINASPHGDHSNSNEVFKNAGAVIIAHRNARDVMVKSTQSPTARFKPPLPEIIYDDNMTLFLGGKRIELHYFGPGHTLGDTAVYLPDDKVLFMSENYFSNIFISIGEGHAKEWLHTVAEAMKLDYVWVIPGHGQISGLSAVQLKAGFQKCYDMVKAIYDNVKRHVDRGDSLEKTMAEIDSELGEFAKLSFYESSVPGLPGFGERSVRGTYNALAGRPIETGAR